MYNFLFSSDSNQALRMFRHLAAVLSLLVFTLICLFFYHNDLFSIDESTFNWILIFFWCGVGIFTIIFRSGLNELSSDPSLTVPQIIWGTCYLLTIVIRELLSAAKRMCTVLLMHLAEILKPQTFHLMICQINPLPWMVTFPSASQTRR